MLLLVRTGRLSCLTAHADYDMYKLGVIVLVFMRPIEYVTHTDTLSCLKSRASYEKPIDCHEIGSMEPASLKNRSHLDLSEHVLAPLNFLEDPSCCLATACSLRCLQNLSPSLEKKGRVSAIIMGAF